MIPRYSHPIVSELWSDEWTYGAWLRIEQLTLSAQIQRKIVPEQAEAFEAWLGQCHVDSETTDWIRTLERTETHHDVAAFLKHWRMARGQEDAKWLHYGLTSSDLVDTAQAMRFRQMRRTFGDAAREMLSAAGKWTEVDQPMLGVTHGQVGEPTSMRARAFGWIAEIEGPLQSVVRQTRAMELMKLSGPMGTFAHNPPQIEVEVATALGLHPIGPGATQILPRSPLSLWASSCAALLAAYAKVAHDLRLLNAGSEVGWVREVGHIGSSAMPHKNNPIEAEQLGGLARMARGYAAMLDLSAPLWLERDISNSGPERVAVPDLWHTVMRATSLLTHVLVHMELRPPNIELNMAQYSNVAWSHRVRLAEIADGATYEDATAIALDNQFESYDVVGDAKWFTRNYPKGKQS